MSRSRRSGHTRYEQVPSEAALRADSAAWQPAEAASPADDQDAMHASSSSLASLPRASPSSPRYRICIVSDFFYPRLGGVELHQYSLAQALLARGHKVIVVTGSYEEGASVRQGVRFVTNGLKVYHIPVRAISQQASLPTLFATFPLLRSIFLRERIQLVHGHQSTSALAHEALLHARTMCLGTVFTDHSLFSFSNAPAINLNKLMKFTLSMVDHVVCVSHCSKENLVLRAYLDPENVSVIPNAVDTTKLTPDTSKAPDMEERFTIVVLSRLVYRKGIDLILEVIPLLCAQFPTVHFLIGGDGPKRALLEQMREKYALQDRVEMIGSVPHHLVPSVLRRGHLFLNASLTEAFCIAILEAVCCGLYVVSTRVGGVPEILPDEMMSFAEPNVPALVETLTRAIQHVRHTRLREPGYAWRVHKQVREMYNWHDVAERTEVVYARVLESHWSTRRMEAEAQEDDELLESLERVESLDARTRLLPAPTDSCVEYSPPLSLSRLQKLHACGVVAGILFVMVAVFDHLLWLFLQWRSPASEMDVAPELIQDEWTSTHDSGAAHEQRRSATSRSRRQ